MPEGVVRGNRLEATSASGQAFPMTKCSSIQYFKTSPEIIRLAVMLYIRFPMPLRNIEELLHGRGNKISHETVRY